MNSKSIGIEMYASTLKMTRLNLQRAVIKTVDIIIRTKDFLHIVIASKTVETKNESLNLVTFLNFFEARYAANVFLNDIASSCRINHAAVIPVTRRYQENVS